MKVKIAVLTFLLTLSGFAQPNNNFLTFDYVDDYVFIPNDSSTYINNQITIEAWYNTNDAITLQPIVEYFEGIHFWINTDSWPGSGANLVDVNGIYHVISFTPNPDSNSWNHLAITYDGLTGEAKVYSNGSLKDSANLGIFTLNADDNIYFGHRSSFFGGPKYYFNGSLSEVRLWNVVRTPAQIQETMNILLTPDYYLSTDSGLVGYYRLDHFEDLGIGADGEDDLRDLSYKQNHGDSYGNPNIVTDINEIPLSPLNDFLVSQNYPNPFNPSTVITFHLPMAGNIELKVYDILGNEIATLVDEYKPAGSYNVEFRIKNDELSSGIYFYQLKAVNPSTGSEQSFIQTKKMAIIK